MKNSKKVTAKNEATSNAAKNEQHSKDYTKYQFKGQSYGKGRLVFAVIQDYVEKHPSITLSELQKTFTVENISAEIVTTPKRDKSLSIRFFREPIRIGKKKIMVTNQWSKNNIENFIKFVQKTLRQEIKVYKPETDKKVQLA